MRFAVKLIISCLVIAACMWITQRKLPTLSGLVSVMPLTGALVLIWAGLDNPGNTGFMLQQCKGALWGILPSILFFFGRLFLSQETIIIAGRNSSRFCRLDTRCIGAPAADT